MDSGVNDLDDGVVLAAQEFHAFRLGGRLARLGHSGGILHRHEEA